jgi:CxxC-x17-CxxC domain-containing protein
MAFNGGGNFRRGGGGGFRRDFDGPREMHKAVCAECKKECEVPFKPREGSQVYCRDCFAKRSGRTPRGEMNHTSNSNADSNSDSDSDEDFDNSEDE